MSERCTHGLVAALCLAGLAIATPAHAEPSRTMAERVDLIVRGGYERPDDALAALEQLRRDAPATREATRALVLARASMQAQAGRIAEANAAAEELLGLAHDGPDAVAGADANLVRALVAESEGKLDVAAALAQSALKVYEASCPVVNAPADVASAAAPNAARMAPCDHRSLWRAEQVLYQRALAMGLDSAASGHARAALAAAEAADDGYRKAISLSAMAFLAAHEGNHDAAHRLMEHAKRTAAIIDDPQLIVRVRNVEALMADLRADSATCLRIMLENLSTAEEGRAPRLAAMVLVNLTDRYAKMNRPADSLKAANRALPVVRRFHDARAERVLVNNAGLAKIGLGRLAEGKDDMARVLALSQRDASLADQAQTLAEYGEALAAAGDWRAALELYHRERAVSDEFMQRNGAAALKEMQLRYDSEVGQRNLSMLARDNALKDATLANRELQHRVWLLLAAVMAVAVTLAALLYRRIRETNRQLAASQARLRLQSERDPLTNLANRRHFHSMIDERAATHGHRFEGALLMVDIDHFKQVNDGHGHAAGDEVLVEMARRLNDAVRDSDMVVRWGGEEFLIVARSVTAEQAELMAQRVLRAVAGTAFAAGGASLPVTASIGYARFPLPPHALEVTWEQAVNLVDMALYTAKSHGRNRAVGIAATAAADVAALRAIEEDFDQARIDGRVTLRTALGPVAIADPSPAPRF